ncbi:hypothetical protein DFH29DRAFT_160903 [Suillus ampliporus]|nr:hypothetical protein DFH29DRAFT_160903 [Suillus ampliporus]
MTPPHTRFDFLFRNHISYHSRHSLNRVESQHSSLKSVPEDGFDSLNRPRNTSVDGRLQLFEKPDSSCVDCTLSGSNHFPNDQASPTAVASHFERNESEPGEAGVFAVRAPQLLAEIHVSQPPFSPFLPPALPCTTSIITVFPTLPSFLPPALQPIPTTTITSGSSAYDTPQPSIPCGTSVDDSSSCSAISDGPPSGIPQSSSACVGCPTSSPTSEDPRVVPIITLQQPSDSPVTQTSNMLTITITSLGPLPTVTSTSTVMISIPLPQPTSVPDINSNPQLRLTIGAIVGGTVGAIALLALLLFIVLWRRRKRQLSVTPFTLLSNAGPTQVESRVRFKLQSTSRAVRPSSSSSSFIQYPDTWLADYSVNRCPSCATDPISSHYSNDDDISVSSVARRQRADELEKLYPYPYPYPSRVPYLRSSSLSQCKRLG